MTDEFDDASWRRFAQLYRLFEELESQHKRRRRVYGFPFNLLEGAINWLLSALNSVIAHQVEAALRKLDELRKKRRNK